MEEQAWSQYCVTLRGLFQLWWSRFMNWWLSGVIWWNTCIHSQYSKSLNKWWNNVVREEVFIKATVPYLVGMISSVAALYQFLNLSLWVTLQHKTSHLSKNKQHLLILHVRMHNTSSHAQQRASIVEIFFFFFRFRGTWLTHVPQDVTQQTHITLSDCKVYLSLSCYQVSRNYELYLLASLIEMV